MIATTFDGTFPAVALMVVLPVEMPVTTPELLTDATVGALDDHASVGVAITEPAASRAVAVICTVAPILTDGVATESESDATALPTVTVADPDLAGSNTEVAVIVVEPAASPATVPALETIATAGFDDDHVTAVLAPPAADTVAVSVVLPPILIVAVAGATVTLETDPDVPPEVPGDVVEMPDPPLLHAAASKVTPLATNARRMRARTVWPVRTVIGRGVAV